MDTVYLDVRVEFDAECGMWVAECDALGIVTEAPSLEALTERVWDLVPDMIEVNRMDIAPDCVRLRFDLPACAGRQQLSAAL